MCIKDMSEYNMVLFFFVFFFSFLNGSLGNPQEAVIKEMHTCKNHHTAVGSGSVFIFFRATLGNFGRNMLMHTFLSDTEIHKAPLSVVNELCIPQDWSSIGKCSLLAFV